MADYFLVLGSDEYADESVSNLKLQKLCYYAQGFSLALHEPAVRRRSWRGGAPGPRGNSRGI